MNNITILSSIDWISGKLITDIGEDHVVHPYLNNEVKLISRVNFKTQLSLCCRQKVEHLLASVRETFLLLLKQITVCKLSIALFSKSIILFPYHSPFFL